VCNALENQEDAVWTAEIVVGVRVPGLSHQKVSLLPLAVSGKKQAALLTAIGKR
jgi:hypothetical protein